MRHEPPLLPRSTPAIALGVLALMQLAPGAAAHVGVGGGEATEFTMPMWVVYFAGALVVALSFALVGAFLSREKEQQRLYRAGETDEERIPQPQAGLTPLRALGLLVLALILIQPMVPGADSRFPSVALWLGIWVILPLLAYTLGDPWPRLSPFAPLLPLARALRGGRRAREYPQKMGMWPAVILLLALIALEVGEFAWTDHAGTLARIAFAYLFLTMLGMVVYGHGWLANAEVVGRMLAWWSAVSPIRWQGNRPRWRGLAGTQNLPALRLDAVAFTIALLYGVSHDVFLHTANGRSAIARLETWGVPLPSVALLLAGFLVFLTAWMIAARAMRDHGESLATVRATAAAFVACLLPIAAAYHLTHNLPYLYQSVPVLLAAATDPLGLGWGPSGFDGQPIPFPSDLLGALAATQILLIILGHLLAVLVAHRLAFRNHPSRVQAVRAEIPLTLAMVLYTGIGLALLGAKGGGLA